MTDTTSGLTDADLTAIEEEVAKAVDIAGHWMVSSSTRRYTVNEAFLLSEAVEKMPRLVREIRRLRVVNRVLGRLVHREYGDMPLAEVAFLFDSDLTDEEEAVLRAMEESE